MKTGLLWIALAWATSLPASAGAPPAALKPLPQQAQTAYLAARVVVQKHYKPMPLDDAMSARIFDQFLKALDPERIFFIDADIVQLGRFRKQLDDAILAEDLSAPFAIFNLCTMRAYQRLAYARSLLAAGFDFSRKEHYRYDRSKAAWPKSESEVRELWRKRVKNDWLRLKLAGKGNPEIVDILDRRYEQATKRVSQLRSADAFEKFMNAYLTSIEPHSTYLAPEAATEFDIALRLALVGIGTTVSEQEDYLTIRDLAPGGPALLSGQIKVGDRIVGAAQGEDGAMTDLVGWRLADAAPLIRGSADSLVRLELLPAEAGPDDPTHVVSLVRKRIRMEDESARKYVVPIEEGAMTRHIGVIELPTFYLDFTAKQKGESDYKSVSHDVARLLAELKAEGVDSILIDLRDNGGGSMSEAIELTGLFIDQGPVVQQRDAHGEISVGRSTAAVATWDGPLGVLINRRSASASEVFAAAIQDYQRGLLIGEPSFGKGTAQTLINLDRLAHNDQALYGELKLTIAQIFRVSGGSTQGRGVVPDIPFSHASERSNDSEASTDNALPWRELKAVDYAPVADMNALRPILLAKHQARVKKDRDFQSLRDEIADLERLRRSDRVSLNESERRQENEAQQGRQRLRAKRSGRGLGETEHGITPPTADLADDDGVRADEDGQAEQRVSTPAKDVFVIEAATILGDEVKELAELALRQSRAAARPPPLSTQAAQTTRSGVL